MSGEALMEHMKFVHKDPNASGVPGTKFGLKITIKKHGVKFIVFQQQNGAMPTTLVRSVGSSM